MIQINRVNKDSRILPHHYNECMIDENLTSEHIGSLLRERGLMLATAESCSGGLLGHLLTNIPGSSDYYLGGVVAYSNQSKLLWQGVQPDTLAQYGAVSRETVLEMAAGLRRHWGFILPRNASLAFPSPVWLVRAGEQSKSRLAWSGSG